MKLRLDMTLREKTLLRELLENLPRAEDAPVASRLYTKLEAAWHNASTKSSGRR